MIENLMSLLDRFIKLDDIDISNLSNEIIDEFVSFTVPTYFSFNPLYIYLNRILDLKIENLNNFYEGSIELLKKSKIELNNINFYNKWQDNQILFIEQNLSLKEDLFKKVELKKHLDNRFWSFKKDVEDIKTKKEEDIEKLKVRLESVLLNYVILKYYNLMKFRLDILIEKKLAGDLEKYHSSPEWIIMILCSLLSGTVGAVISKLLPEISKLGLFKHKYSFILKLKRFYGWIRRENITSVFSSQIVFLDKKINNLTKTLIVYQEKREKINKKLTNNDFELNSIDNLIKDIKDKLTIINEYLLKIKVQKELYKRESRRIPQKEKIRFETKILFPEEIEKITAITYIIEKSSFYTTKK